MEFRGPTIAAALDVKAIKYLTRNLTDPEAGRRVLDGIMNELGHATDAYPEWHPLLTAPENPIGRNVFSLSQLPAYEGMDHTIEFVRGFITCPYSDAVAKKLVENVSEIDGLHAYQLDAPLYSDHAYPVVVEAMDVVLEADGTIRGRDVLQWFLYTTVAHAKGAQVAETWWTMRPYLLGHPHGSRSSLFVNQHTGAHIRKILEALNNSGIFGPIKESSLEMLSEKKRKTISETLVRTAVKNWNGTDDKFEFELRGETCQAEVRDTFDDGDELSVRVTIGSDDLHANGFYYGKNDRVDVLDPTGKRALAEKFL
jgi:hypothetical protein